MITTRRPSCGDPPGVDDQTLKGDLEGKAQFLSKLAQTQHSCHEERLEDQIGWYDRKSQTAQRRYKALKLAQVIIAGLIPLASVFPIPDPQFKWVTAILGLLVLTIEAPRDVSCVVKPPNRRGADPYARWCSPPA